MGTTSGEVDKEFVDGLARGLTVIEAFDAATPEMTLSEVARKTGLSPASARRSLHTLAVLGYVRSANKRFVLTPRILSLGAAYTRSTHIEDALLPELRKFVGDFGDASSVAVLSDTNILYVAHCSASSGLRPVAGAGVTYPAYVTSMGRVLLAELSATDVARYLKAASLRALTDRTEIDPGRLQEIIEGVRVQGYATVVDQLAYGVTALAVPIKVASGQTVAAINTSGYSGRLTPDQLVKERLTALWNCATRIAAMLETYPALRHSLEQEPLFQPLGHLKPTEHGHHHPGGSDRPGTGRSV